MINVLPYFGGMDKFMVKNILTVDDEEHIVYTVKHGLEGMDADYSVITVNSGKECFDFLEKNKLPDLILLDIMMPDMTGWEVLKKIKDNPAWSKIPVIFLTARTDRVAENAGSFLAEDYIEKPFEVPELKERIDKLLKK